MITYSQYCKIVANGRTKEPKKNNQHSEIQIHRAISTSYTQVSTCAGVVGKSGSCSSVFSLIVRQNKWGESKAQRVQIDSADIEAWGSAR
jgi:hypothetical protein